MSEARIVNLLNKNCCKIEISKAANRSTKAIREIVYRKYGTENLSKAREKINESFKFI